MIFFGFSSCFFGFNPILVEKVLKMQIMKFGLFAEIKRKLELAMS